MSKTNTKAVVRQPNATTQAAIAELEAGRGKRVATVEALMAD